MSEKGIQGFYLHHRDIEGEDTCIGSDRKVKDQIACLNEAGLNCRFLHCPQPETVFGMVKASLPGLSDGVGWPHAEDLRCADYIYIRRPRIISRELVEMTRGYKRLNPSGVALLEIPTYPYDPEWMNPKMYLALRKDRKYRAKLSGVVDRMIDLSGNQFLFGVPTLRMINGIDMSRIKPKKPVDDLDSINIAFAAYFTRIHGADRLISGLGEYYDQGGDRDITIHLAGDGSVMFDLKKLVVDLGIEGRVEFCGSLNAEELDDLYDQCSLAVGVLGLHRFGHSTTSALKTREYLAKGIPFVYAGGVDVFDSNPMDFCLRFSSDETALDFNEIVEFHDSLYSEKGQESVIARMREYAQDNVSMDKAMKEVVDYIQLSCRNGEMN